MLTRDTRTRVKKNKTARDMKSEKKARERTDGSFSMRACVGVRFIARFISRVLVSLSRSQKLSSAPHPTRNANWKAWFPATQSYTTHHSHSFFLFLFYFQRGLLKIIIKNCRTNKSRENLIIEEVKSTSRKLIGKLSFWLSSLISHTTLIHFSYCYLISDRDF